MRYNNESGFSLIEVVIAIAILGVGIMAMYSMQATGVIGNASANRLTMKSTWAADQIESMVNLEYDDNMLRDIDSDGTDQDLDYDGIDDNGGNFGLYDLGGGADSTSVTADGKYTISLNVAIDHPMEKVKTICVLVLNNSDGKSVAYKYMKSDPI